MAAVAPTILARHHRRRQGLEPLAPDAELGHAADYLRMLTGAPAPDAVVEALQAYFVLTMDHGFNSSTFATRVVASTGADLGACVVAGYAALSGPRHGAAIERILDMFDAVGEPGVDLYALTHNETSTGVVMQLERPTGADDGAVGADVATGGRVVPV